MTDHGVELGEELEVVQTDEPRNDVVVPLLGMIVDTTELTQVALALDAVREAKRMLDSARYELERLLGEEAQRRGTKTLHLDKADVTISGGPQTVYDIEVLAQLQEAGLPEDRYNQLVKTRVEYRVDGNVARQLLGSGNEDYIAILRKAASTEERPYRADVKRA